MQNVIDAGDGTYVVIDGAIVERDALNIAERIQDYDDKLHLVCLDPDKAEINDAPFLVLEELPNGTLTVAFEAWQLDERLLERIYNADQRRTDSLVLIDEMMKKKREANERRYNEVKEERKDIMLACISSPKSSFTVVNKEGDEIKINEKGPKTINRAKKSFVAVGVSSRYTPPRKV